MSSRSLTEKVRRFADENAGITHGLSPVSSGLWAVFEFAPTSFKSVLYDPVICLILQGRKETQFGGRVVSFGAGEHLVVSHRVPVDARVVEATRNRPYLGLVLSIDIEVARSMQDELGDISELPQGNALEIDESDSKLVDAVERLFDLRDDAVESQVIAPLIKREIYLRILLGRNAGLLRELISVDSRASNIARVIAHIQEHYSEPLPIAFLARIARMSESSFHAHFKLITAMTPLQYVKELRLLEARRLLTSGETHVSRVAIQVGYESASQFSREYSRKFGTSPRDSITAGSNDN